MLILAFNFLKQNFFLIFRALWCMESAEIYYIEEEEEEEEEERKNNLAGLMFHLIYYYL